MTFTLTQSNIPGDPVRIATAGGFPTYHSAAYAAMMTAAQQNCRVSISDEHGDHQGCWDTHRANGAAITGIIHRDRIERMKNAADRLDSVIKKTALLESLANQLREIGEDTLATDLVVDAQRLLARHESRLIFGRPCEVVAAEIIPDGWYEDSYTKAHADSVQMALDSIRFEEHATEEEWMVAVR